MFITSNLAVLNYEVGRALRRYALNPGDPFTLFAMKLKIAGCPVQRLRTLTRIKNECFCCNIAVKKAEGSLFFFFPFPSRLPVKAG